MRSRVLIRLDVDAFPPLYKLGRWGRGTTTGMLYVFVLAVYPAGRHALALLSSAGEQEE